MATKKAKKSSSTKAAKKPGASPRAAKPTANTLKKPAKATQPKPANTDRPKRASGLDLAAEVLATSDKPLNAKTIAERVIAAGWKTDGRTPHATLYAAMVREITTKKDASRFRKMDRGLFAAGVKA